MNGFKNRKDSGKRVLQPLFNGKVPPQEPNIEAAVLGAMINESACIDNVLEILADPECFYIDTHRKVYEAIRVLYDKGAPVDELTVTAQLRNMGVLDEMGGAYMVNSLSMGVLSSAHLVSHCLILKERYLSRELIKLGGVAISEGYDREAFELLEDLDGMLYKLNASMMAKDFVTSQRVAKEVLDKEQEMLSNPDKLIGIPTGNAALDKITGGGWKPGQLIIKAARPAVGKTSNAMNEAYCATVVHNIPGGIFSMEMERGQLFNILTAIDTGINTAHVEDPKLREGDENKRIMESRAKLAKCKWVFDDTPGLKIIEVRAKARRMKKKHGIRYLIIDYLQLMGGDGKEWNRDQEISNITRELKKLAKELQIPIIALCQLNREVEKRDKQDFKLSDLRESGGIEQDADIVIFLWRPSDEEQQKDPEVRGTGKAIIGKHRGGKLDRILYSVDLTCQRWRDYAPFSAPLPAPVAKSYAGYQDSSVPHRKINWNDPID